MELTDAKHHFQGDDSVPGRIVPDVISCRYERTGSRPVSWRRTRRRLPRWRLARRRLAWGRLAPRRLGRWLGRGRTCCRWRFGGRRVAGGALCLWLRLWPLWLWRLRRMQVLRAYL